MLDIPFIPFVLVNYTLQNKDVTMTPKLLFDMITSILRVSYFIYFLGGLTKFTRVVGNNQTNGVNVCTTCDLGLETILKET